MQKIVSKEVIAIQINKCKKKKKKKKAFVFVKQWETKR